MKIDLHTHSTCSDGTMTPKELMHYAKEKQLDVIALSDHDCLKGLAEARKYAEQLNIKLIDAIEFAGFYIDRELHILGLFVDLNNKQFVQTVNSIEEGRYQRNAEMVRRFNKINIPIKLEDLNGGDPNKIITRSHFATYLIKNNYVKTKEEAFDKYLFDGCETYLPREYYSTKEIIDIIHNAGGIAVLAHPTLYKFDDVQIKTMVSQLVSEGLDGIEGHYSTYTKEQTNFILSLAKDFNLLVTGGSDFHGDTKPGLDLYTGYGNLEIPKDLLLKILEKHNYTL